MKCVKSAEGKYLRVADERAEKLVKAGTHAYCPKHEWRAAGRPR